jgi:hypothetical protein
MQSSQKPDVILLDDANNVKGVLYFTNSLRELMIVCCPQGKLRELKVGAKEIQPRKCSWKLSLENRRLQELDLKLPIKNYFSLY